MAGTTLDLAKYEQIATLLSQLMTDYNALIENFYNIFFNPEPMDVTISLYNLDGVLKEYTIPNRAKDFTYVRNGSGSPEGNELAPVGTIYQDTTNGVLYIKETGTGRTGWIKVGGDVYIESGDGSPQGKYSRSIGSLYVDKTNADLYIKSTNYGKNGWVLISAKSISVDYSGA